MNESGPTQRAVAVTAPAKRSSLVYWSSKESRWKPVASAGTASMQAARSAAAEVTQYFGLRLGAIGECEDCSRQRARSSGLRRKKLINRL